MTMHKALHTRDDKQTICVKKRRKRTHQNRGLRDTSIQGLEDYIKKNKERLIIATRNSTDNININRRITTKKKQEEK